VTSLSPSRPEARNEQIPSRWAGHLPQGSTPSKFDALLAGAEAFTYEVFLIIKLPLSIVSLFFIRAFRYSRYRVQMAYIYGIPKNVLF
jgi:hypothetical protein